MPGLLIFFFNFLILLITKIVSNFDSIHSKIQIIYNKMICQTRVHGCANLILMCSVGTECRERAKECVMNHCSHQGQCLSLGWNKDEETFRCVCPPAYHGPRCESLRQFLLLVCYHATVRPFLE